jgi:diacylglycerol kinase (ATP)
MKIKVILNPYANRWRAGSRVAEVQAAFTAVSLQPDMIQTTKPREAIALAETAVAEGYDAVVAAGGDGTLNEVANGLLRAAGEGPTIPFGILPIGTANDFSDMAGLPRSLTEAAQIIAAGQTRQIDAGRINDHFFINNCAVAMEPMITLENIRMKRLSGELRYVVALLRGLVKLKAWDMQVRWDDGGYDGPTYLLSVCNGPRTGGFYMAPDALLDDGLFDFVFTPEVSKLTVLSILVKLFRKTHIYHPQVVYGRTRRITITSSPGTPIHADGEIIAEAATQIEYQILPGKLTLLHEPLPLPEFPHTVGIN